MRPGTCDIKTDSGLFKTVHPYIGVGVDLTRRPIASLDYRYMATEKGQFDATPVGSGNVVESGCNGQSAMLSLRYVLAEATPAGRKVTANGCAVNQSLVLKNVHFAFNQALLTNDSKTVLDAMARTILDSPGFRIEIGGNTDSIGSDAANQKLSESRAGSVRSYLLGKGVSASVLSAKGYGEASPVASNDDDTGRADNRRVELRVID